MSIENNKLNHTPPLRKYQLDWERLKRTEQLELTLSGDLKLSKEQKAKIFQTIRKAISKEKYGDMDYKIRHPNAEITSVVHIANGTITFKLNPDNKDISGMFV